MDLFRKIRLYFYHNSIRKILEKTQPIRKSTNLGKAKHIGILFDANLYSESVLNYADKLEGLGKKVQLLGYFKDSNDRANLAFDHFNKKQLNYTYFSENQLVKEFTNRSFDILINVFFQENLPLEHISIASKAHFRIGYYTTKIHCFDLMIDMPDSSFDVDDFFQEIEAILPIMKNKKYESTTV